MARHSKRPKGRSAFPINAADRRRSSSSKLARSWPYFAIYRLENRTLFSGSNALDRLDFGNMASEAAHHFDPGVSTANLPALGAGTEIVCNTLQA